jgi:hypothetical protein
MRLLETFCDVFYGTFDQFAQERNDAKRWPDTLKEIRKWIAGRYSRH